MRYILTSGWEDGIADLTQRLVHELAAGKRVLWLVSGGSNIPASVQIMKNIPSTSQHLLTVLPADERYGAPGHDDSNMAQLTRAGFAGGEATLPEVLLAGASLADTARHYQTLVERAFDQTDCVIGQLGIGEDGHLAGILPNSPAATATEALIVGYNSPPYQRLTLTATGIQRLTAAYVFAFGAAKHQALINLKSRRLPVTEQPAQILKTLSEVYIYSDQLGDTL